MTSSRRLNTSLAMVAFAVACTSTARPRTNSASYSVAELDPSEAAVLRATLDTIVRGLRDSSTLCLSILGGPAGAHEPSDAFLRSLSLRRSVVRATECPPTYQRMIARVDADGRNIDPVRPPGYVDPYVIEIGRPQFARPAYAWVYVRQLQGTRGRDYLCTLIGFTPGAQVVCQINREWIH